MLRPLPLADLKWTDSKPIWMSLTDAHRHLAELKGLCESLPSQGILLDTLGIQEAKDSSEIENIITTHDELYMGGEDAARSSAAAKEVRHYVAALKIGYKGVRESGLIRFETVLAVQSELVQNRAGLRKLPGTVLKNDATGRVVYQPPRDAAEIDRLMGNLIDFIQAGDGDDHDELDPLLRMVIAHHQFESIHPFYDGNGRTGRILNLLMLQHAGLLDLPVLYLSRYITTTKPDYYRLLQAVRDDEKQWLDWALYVLRGVSLTAQSAIRLVRSLRDLMMRTKHNLREQLPKLYSQDLLNNLFRHPYTKIEYVERDLDVSRITASKYLDRLGQAGFVRKQKIGKSNFYINEPLFALLTGVTLEP